MGGGDVKLLVIIPAYNEEDAILGTVQSLQRHCPEADYIVINDCSRDGTRKVLRDHGIPYLDLPMNLGIGGGVQTGYKYAVEHGYDVTVQFDGDGQHRAEYISALVQPIAQGKADMVVGSRFVAGDGQGFQSSAMRRAGINFLSGLIRLCTGQRVLDATSGFRACGRALTEEFADSYAQDYPEPEAIVTALVRGYRVKEIPVQMNERQGGVSSIGALKSVYYMVKVSLAVLLTGLRLTGRKEVQHHE